MMIQGLSNNDGGQITANGKVTATVSHTLANSASINLATIDFTGTRFSNANGTINVAQATINTNLLDNSQGQFIACDTLLYVGTCFSSQSLAFASVMSG